MRPPRRQIEAAPGFPAKVTYILILPWRRLRTLRRTVTELSLTLEAGRHRDDFPREKARAAFTGHVAERLLGKSGRQSGGHLVWRERTSLLTRSSIRPSPVPTPVKIANVSMLR
jgi:hypothetical protein